jgi:predicted neutral ceramidase superfamily lipid hydrolase
MSNSTMTLKRRLYLAVVLAPAFWLLFVWLFFLSPQAHTTNIWFAAAYSLLMSYAAAYSAVLFGLAWRASFIDSK